jgi:hypothetical protein
MGQLESVHWNFGVAVHNVVIFLGPSLDVATARSILPATYLPPIKRGDLSKLPSDVDIVGIIDGQFYQTLAVSPKEVLELLARGVAVFGASSIGALRAAETHTYGTKGVGEIFRLYRDGIIDSDDEVAVTYDPETFRPLSNSLVDIRDALAAATSMHIIDVHEAEQVVRRMQEMYFPYRSYRLVSQICPAIESVLRTTTSLKCQDALLLLKQIRKAYPV